MGYVGFEEHNKRKRYKEQNSHGVAIKRYVHIPGKYPSVLGQPINMQYYSQTSLSLLERRNQEGFNEVEWC